MNLYEKELVFRKNPDFALISFSLFLSKTKQIWLHVIMKICVITILRSSAWYYDLLQVTGAP